MKRTLIQNKPGSLVKLISLLTLLILICLVTSWYLKSPTEFVFNNYSIKVERRLYPVLSEEEWVEVYTNKSSAEVAQTCQESDQGTIEKPCGYETLIYQVLVYKTSKNFEDGNQYTDTQHRIWHIKKQPPLTGSIFKTEGHEAQTKIGNTLYTLQIAVPHYSTKEINQEYFHSLLDSFSVKY